MAAKSNAFAADLLKLIFQAIPIANLADNAAAVPLTNLYVSLHTATPDVGGDQTTHEAAYPGYARRPVLRAAGAGGFTITGTPPYSVSPTETVVFPAATGSPSETEQFFGIGTSLTGTGKLLYFGPITPPIAVTAVGVEPQLLTTSTVSES